LHGLKTTGVFLFKKIVPALALVFILFVLSKNVIYFPAFLRSMVTGHPLTVSENPPGRDFLALIPYLKNAPIAGYYTDRYNENFWNSDIASRIYQQAQYALAPTLLDVEKCFEHAYIIFECQYANCEVPLIKERGLELLVKLNDKISLARAINKPRRTP
jgi:hypothetical protein